jgi:hypothetical protein
MGINALIPPTLFSNKTTQTRFVRVETKTLAAKEIASSPDTSFPAKLQNNPNFKTLDGQECRGHSSGEALSRGVTFGEGAWISTSPSSELRATFKSNSLLSNEEKRK